MISTKLFKWSMRRRAIGLFSGLSALMLVALSITFTWMTYCDWRSHFFENHLSNELDNVLQDFENRFVEIVETTKNIADNHYIINSFVDEAGRMAYLPNLINGFKNYSHLSTVNILSFYGKSLLPKQEPFYYDRFKNDMWNVVGLGESVVRVMPEANKVITIFPVSYYDTPQGAVFVEWNLASIITYHFNDKKPFFLKVYIGEKEYLSVGFEDKKNYIKIRSSEKNRFQNLNNLRLEIEIGIEKSIYLAKVKHYTLRSVIVAFWFVLLAVFVGYRLGDHIVAPVKRLSEKVRAADCCQPVKIGAVGMGDELADLGAAFEEKTRALLGIQEEFKNSSDLLRETNEQLLLLGSVFKNAVDGILIVDGTGRILHANPAFSDISNYGTEEVVGLEYSFALSLRLAHGHVTVWKILHEKKTWEGEVWIRSKKDEFIPCWCLANGAADSTHFIFAFHDIRERKQSQELLFYQSNHDALTGLFNIKMCSERIAHAIDRARKNGGSLAIMVLQIKNLKKIIDGHGFHTGELFIQEIANRLRACCGSLHLVAKFEGEEFAVVMENISQRDEVIVLARKILTHLQKNLTVSGHLLACSVDVGVALFPDHASNEWDLLRFAGIAVRTTKKINDSNIQIFNEKIKNEVERRQRMELQLRAALSEGQLCLHYQPKICLVRGSIVGVEALMRWPLEEGGFISPAEFIPLTEEAGLMIPMGEYALQMACEDMKAFHDAGFPLSVAVNISPSHFVDTDIVYGVSSILNKTGFPAEFLEIEITEGVIIESKEKVIKNLLELRRMGVTVSLDDFGTGYSCLGSLQNLPLNCLKIDISFIRELPHNQQKSKLVSLIIQIAKIFNMKVVAEGVESVRQFEYLKEQKCDQVQGYFLSPPLAAGQLLQSLQVGKWPIFKD